VADKAIDTGGVRPVRFDSDDIEPVALDQEFRNGGTRAIEFRCPVRRFAQQRDFRVAEPLEFFVEFRCVERWQGLTNASGPRAFRCR